MRTSELIIIQQPMNQDKLEALKAFLIALKIKFEVTSEDSIPIEHQNFVLNRVKNSHSSELLNWNDVKDDFDGI